MFGRTFCKYEHLKIPFLRISKNTGNSFKNNRKAEACQAQDNAWYRYCTGQIDNYHDYADQHVTQEILDRQKNRTLAAGQKDASHRSLEPEKVYDRNRAADQDAGKKS